MSDQEEGRGPLSFFPKNRLFDKSQLDFAGGRVKKLYARFVLWMIKPALEQAREREPNQHAYFREVISAQSVRAKLIDDLRREGAI